MIAVTKYGVIINKRAANVGAGVGAPAASALAWHLKSSGYNPNRFEVLPDPCHIQVTVGHAEIVLPASRAHLLTQRPNQATAQSHDNGLSDRVNPPILI